MSKLESMTKEDISQWLESKGYLEPTIKGFLDEEMDGNAISFGLASSPGPDWLKDIVPTLGQRLKVHNDLRTLLNQERQGPSPSPSRSITPDLTATAHGFTSPPPSDCGSSSSLKSPSTSKSARVKTEPLDSFQLPRFRHETEENLERKILRDTDRKHCVQTIATLLMQHTPKPTLKQCGLVAKQMINKYPFLKDDEGEGEHSWKWFLYYRTQNVNRQASHTAPVKKKRKIEDSAVHLYPGPPVNAEDEVSHERNLKLLAEEMEKDKPRSQVLKDLMRRTYGGRWDSFVNRSEPSTLSEYIQMYPLLKKSTFATLDFSIACNKPNIRSEFEETFPVWARAVIMYSKETQVRSTSLQVETAEYTEDTADDVCVVMALRCLALLFFTGKTKKLGEGIPYVLREFNRGTPVEEVLDKNNNQPNIIFLRDDDEDPHHQLFIAVEQTLMLESNNLVTAVFLGVVAHYVFNLEYHPKTGDFWLFLQERVLGIPSKPGTKRHPSSSSHFSGIGRMYEKLIAEIQS